MRITKLSLTNFRSFKETQTIEFAPITLLFGPNSVGKSTVLMALAYVQHILDKGQCNPMQLDVLGGKKVGGFKSLVNGQDLKQPIRIKVEFEVGGTHFERYENEIESTGSEYPTIQIPDISAKAKTIAIEWVIVWSEQFSKAYIAKYRVWMNGEYVGCISASSLRNTAITDLNTRHSLFVSDEYRASVSELDEFIEDNDLSKLHNVELVDLLNASNPNGRTPPETINPEFCGAGLENLVSPIGVKYEGSALPLLGNTLPTQLDVEWYMDSMVLKRMFSQIFVFPLDVLKEYLDSSAFLGPLRIVPDDHFQANPNIDQKDWFDGSAAWNKLYEAPKDFDSGEHVLSRTAHWLSSVDKLDTGYDLLNVSMGELHFRKALKIKGDDLKAIGKIDDAINKADEPLKSAFKERHLFFKDIKSGMLLNASQLGTGISQVVPLIVAATCDKTPFVTIEQPELHIHPRFQTELADLFLDGTQARDYQLSTIKPTNFLIETHSEHLILRLLKRIRQTTDGELPEGTTALKPDDVSVVYLEPGDNGVISTRLPIDEDGEFTKRWPRGFFGERREELM